MYLGPRTWGAHFIPKAGEKAVRPSCSSPARDARPTGWRCPGPWRGGEPPVPRADFADKLVCPASREQLPPGGVDLGAAIEARDQRLLMVQCTITHVGTYALELGPGCKEISSEYRELTDLGGGG